MAYEICCTDVPSQSERMPDHYRVVNSDSMSAAITAACKLIADGVIVWKIRGPDGFTMERSDIETERLRRQGAAV